jgi:hypothetical protein
VCSGNAVIDHFEYDGSFGAEDHAAVLASHAVQSAAVLPGGLSGPVLFRGIGLSVAPESETVGQLLASLRGACGRHAIC